MGVYIKEDMMAVVELDEDFEYMYVREAKYGGGFDVMGVGIYPDSSVLAGQERITFVDCCETIEECEEKYPACKDSFHGAFTEPRNTYDHLPDTQDGYEWDGE